jgi:serine/threonine protein kinase
VAIKHLHGKGVSHRDIKPDNLLYDQKTGNIKLIDFDISKVCKNKKTRNEMWTKTGTIQYCAPEMFTGGYSEMVDIWAVGVLTYELLCGKFPFEI